MQFDLISDLHVENWEPEQQPNWEGLGTSLVAVIAGDVSRDLDLTYQTVVNISQHYKHVVYVDGNHEHDSKGGINARREEIAAMFKKYRNITYLYRATIILDNTAFIGSNGWCSYDFCEPMMSKQECFHDLIDLGKNQDVMFEQWEMAMEDADYLARTVNLCSRDNTVKQIVLVTHTAPLKDFTWLPGSNAYHLLGEQGSSFLEGVLEADVNKKVKTWAFGHIHRPVDQVINGVRYVSNPRGAPGHHMAQTIYYPKYIKS